MTDLRVDDLRVTKYIYYISLLLWYVCFLAILKHRLMF